MCVCVCSKQQVVNMTLYIVNQVIIVWVGRFLQLLCGLDILYCVPYDNQPLPFNICIYIG